MCTDSIHHPHYGFPIVAVVDNELYAAVYRLPSKVLKKYDKSRRVWITLGDLPDSPASYGIALRACGNRLLLVGGPGGGAAAEIYSSTLMGSPPQWQRMATLSSGTFVYNCAVMEII